jgi:hypothetical protein
LGSIQSGKASFQFDVSYLNQHGGLLRDFRASSSVSSEPSSPKILKSARDYGSATTAKRPEELHGQHEVEYCDSPAERYRYAQPVNHLQLLYFPHHDPVF